MSDKKQKWVIVIEDEGVYISENATNWKEAIIEIISDYYSYNADREALLLYQKALVSFDEISEGIELFNYMFENIDIEYMSIIPEGAYYNE